MAKVSWRGGALLAPVPPVMVSCGSHEHANIVTVAWTGIVNTHPAMTYISLRPSRYSHEIISQTKEFAINLTPASLVRTADYCGMYTGKKVDKFEKCHLDKEQAQIISAPLIAQAPLCLECRVTQVIPLGSHDMFLAQIVSVSVDESLLDAQGKLHLNRAGLAAFAHGEYFALGERIGSFGCSVRKKQASKRKPHQTKK